MSFFEKHKTTRLELARLATKCAKKQNRTGSYRLFQTALKIDTAGGMRKEESAVNACSVFFLSCFFPGNHWHISVYFFALLTQGWGKLKTRPSVSLRSSPEFLLPSLWQTQTLAWYRSVTAKSPCPGPVRYHWGGTLILGKFAFVCLGVKYPLITELSGWRAPGEPLRTQESVPDRRTGACLV